MQTEMDKNNIVTNMEGSYFNTSTIQGEIVALFYLTQVVYHDAW